MFQSESSASKAWLMLLSSAVNLLVSEFCLPSQVYLHSNHHAVVKLYLTSWGCSCFPVAGDYHLKWTCFRVQGEVVIMILRKGLLHLCQNWCSHYTFFVEVFIRKELFKHSHRKRGSSNDLPVICCMTQPLITFCQHCLIYSPNLLIYLFLLEYYKQIPDISLNS